MKTFKTLLFSLLFGITTIAFAADGSITITSPADGATIKAGTKTELVYEINPGPRGDHLHIYVGDKDGVIKAGDMGDIVRSFKGSHTLPKLAGGEYTIIIKVVDRGHTPVGIEKTIKVTVK